MFVLKIDREGELLGEEFDYYKVMEEEEDEGESYIWWREFENRINERKYIDNCWIIEFMFEFE